MRGPRAAESAARSRLTEGPPVCPAQVWLVLLPHSLQDTVCLFELILVPTPYSQDGATLLLNVGSLRNASIDFQGTQIAFKLHDPLIGVFPSFNLLSPFLRESHLRSKEKC